VESRGAHSFLHINYSLITELIRLVSYSVLVLLCCTSGIQAQVVKRDTLIEWSHFDYQLDADYGLESFSSTDIVTSTFQGIVLENEYVKICLIPEFGARIISFVYKPTGKEQLYQNPIGVPYQIGSGIFYHDWLMVYGGIFPTFPEPEHGKYWTTPWNERILADSPDEITVSMWLKDELDNPRHPGQYNNGVTGITCYFDVTLVAGQPYFTVDVRLENDARTARYEYWTCLTLAPGSDVGNTFTPSASEMIVPIETYQVAWNPNNWMNGLDEVVSTGNPRIQTYDKLAHLSNWENMGIAYAYPDMQAPYYGVINHTNEQGVFRLSNDQSQTPGLKFWTWGDAQGLAADPTDFNNEARPYIELWSGVSQEFFEDAILAANATKAWQETYVPTVGIPVVNYLNEAVAFGSTMNETTLVLYGFQAAAQTNEYTLAVEVLSQDGTVVHSSSEKVTPDPLQSQQFSVDVSTLGLSFGDYDIRASVSLGGDELHTDHYTYNVEGTVPFDPELRLVNGVLELTFQSETLRNIYLYDLMGNQLAFKQAEDQQVQIPYPGYGVYILNVLADGKRWSKKIQIVTN